MCVASCECVADAQTHVFNAFSTFSFPALSSVHRRLECVCLQRQKCLSPAQNMFVTSDKPVRLQCHSYLEVSSKGDLTASDECVRLQCEIIFGGE